VLALLLSGIRRYLLIPILDSFFQAVLQKHWKKHEGREFDAPLQYTNSLINYDILLMQNNQRNLPNASLVNANQQAIKDNDKQIQLNRQFDMYNFYTL
jgi:hypothetical protein